MWSVWETIFSLQSLTFFLGKSCKPVKPLAPDLVYLLCSPWGPILVKEARKGQGLCGLEGGAEIVLVWSLSLSLSPGRAKQQEIRRRELPSR